MATKDTFRTPDRTQPKWRYIWLDEDNNWTGTNDPDLASDVDAPVCDCLKGEDYESGEPVKEYSPDEEEEEEDEEDEEDEE